MQGSQFRSRLVAGAVILTVAAPALLAQQALSVLAQAPATAQPDLMRTQIEAFERSLRGAIDAAAGQLSARVRQAFPGNDFAFQYQSDPIVTGVLMPDVGPLFHVLIPRIDGLSLQVWKLNEQQAQRVNLPTALPRMANPDDEYTALARQALIDAVLDHALSLPVPPDQHLTVIAGELPSQPVSPFQQRSRMLMLQLKGEDLTALRLKNITRDEARNRIKESKYPN